MSEHKQAWLAGMYIVARNYGHEVFDSDPTIDLNTLESSIYNHLVEFDIYKKYTKAVASKSKQAAQRVLNIKGE